MPELKTQPTAAPTRKVLFGAVAGILVYLLTFASGHVWGAEIPGEIASAIPVLAALATSYIVRDRDG
ncbi:MAG: hypothetical protein EA417_02180 [Gammaproteobacteria bacterium]|nr:MAG: hypothetical protein EA417_02180 [Gammaproteobacteria bacterium]